MIFGDYEFLEEKRYIVDYCCPLKYVLLIAYICVWKLEGSKRRQTS